MILKFDTLQLRIEENQLRGQISCLSVEQKRHYYAQESEQIKDPDIYALLNWFCITGLNHFYLGNFQRGLINIFILLTGVLFCISNTYIILGLTILILAFIIELPQLFDSENIVKNYNNQLMKKILEQFD
jgi:hypothetical protein